MSATTAGRSVLSTLCSTRIVRYFRYSPAMSVTITHEGSTHPSVATIAPGAPAIFCPTNVAALIAMGPGVICEIVMRSVNSSMLSQPCSETIWSWMSGSAA